MPHWYGIVSTQTPDFLKGLAGQGAIQQAILDHAPEGASVRTFQWHKNEPKVGVTVWGNENAERYLRDVLEADPVVELHDTEPVG
jgi:hypothetical protein